MLFDFVLKWCCVVVFLCAFIQHPLEGDRATFFLTSKGAVFADFGKVLPEMGNSGGVFPGFGIGGVKVGECRVKDEGFFGIGVDFKGCADVRLLGAGEFFDELPKFGGSKSSLFHHLCMDRLTLCRCQEFAVSLDVGQ